jgi:hypothetical protein
MDYIQIVFAILPIAILVWILIGTLRVGAQKLPTETPSDGPGGEDASNGAPKNP